MGIERMRILSFGKWALPILTQTKINSRLEALLEEFSKINMLERLQKSLEDISVRNMYNCF